MTKNEFLRLLFAELGSLPREEVKKAMAYYSATLDDRMEDGMSEEEAVQSLGEVREIAQEILQSVPLNVLMKSRIQREKKRLSALQWVLIVCGSPLWLSLAATILAVVLSVYVAIWSAIASLYAGLLALGLCGTAGLAGSIMLIFINGPITGGMFAGGAIVCAGLFLIALGPVVGLSKGLVRASAWIGKKTKRMLFPRKEGNK